ncbi:putative neutral zinc metallopeptidase [Caloramator mitchellensis]|uniref:Putative neutral zinc metallopeptidase n=1 Tax=Caloramator mitchellensis TaxID=908809 RepID=A0A0R3K091_CALMK|nr:zinc metallopeptidase [Caloramator mitchellensis]KRQ86926.1 putative neutral zinc metallopeptidase [Caloramator mitchellensis]
MYFGYDPTFILLIPALILSFYAQGKIQSTFAKYFKVRAMRGLTGAEAARLILDRNGLYDVPVVAIRGRLTDHYDPTQRVLRLSEDVYYSNSIASIGVAAHEAGHAIQHSKAYAPLMLRNSLVPVANIGSNVSWVLILMGFFLGAFGLVRLGILLFSSVVLFQIITLPVEYNASSRALLELESNGVLYEDEIRGAKKVLSAAALTYVAATLMAVSQLLRLLLISRDRD